MGVFSSGGVGIDLGSANITIFLENEGVVLREPSFVLALRSNTDEVLAVGREARQMLGRTPKDVVLLSPVMDGAVTDIELASLLIQALSEKAIGRKRALERTSIVVSASLGATKVERAALEAVVRALDARHAAIVRSPIAAAIGGGVPISEAKGIMVVLIGGSTTEVAVVSMNGIVASRSTRTGGLSIDEAIMRYVRNEHGLIIGQRTAEDLKIDIGSAKPMDADKAENVLLRGRAVSTGKPATVTISSLDIHRAMERPIETLMETIRDAVENTPPELAVDLMERGIYLSGGGAQLTGLRERLSEMTKLPVTLGEAPEVDVSAGAGILASDDRLAQKIEQTGCLVEI